MIVDDIISEIHTHNNPKFCNKITIDTHCSESNGDVEATAQEYYQNEVFDSEEWLQQFDNSSFYDDILADIFINKRLITASSPRVLDIGFGSGKEMRWLYQHVPQVQYVGLDFSPAFIRTAWSQFAQIKKELDNSHTEKLIEPQIIRGNALHLPFEGDSFDAVFAFALIHHFEYGHVPGFIRKLSEILKYRGVAVISVREGLGLEKSSNGMSYARYTAKQFSDILTSEGFILTTMPDRLISQAEKYNNASYLVFTVINTKNVQYPELSKTYFEFD